MAARIRKEPTGYVYWRTAIVPGPLWAGTAEGACYIMLCRLGLGELRRWLCA